MTTKSGAVRHRRGNGAEFLVSVAQISKVPGSRREVHFHGVLEDLEVSGSRVPEGEPVEVEAVLESVSGGILVSGRVRTSYIGECRRCLGAASDELKVGIRELCTENPTDEESYPLGTDALDLAPIVHDACILALPLAPLCSEECRGICPGCGANRNLEQCSCVPERDPRWGALNLLYGGETTGSRDEAPVRDE
ncbi:MAG TPA: DUF177 domain-containing protein [Acidimicrobiales bacterium]|nr:DUF177 domain-containing protein [Acidimicrobiales bacterium]